MSKAKEIVYTPYEDENIPNLSRSFKSAMGQMNKEDLKSSVQQEALRIWEVAKNQRLRNHKAHQKFRNSVEKWGIAKSAQKQKALGRIETQQIPFGKSFEEHKPSVTFRDRQICKTEEDFLESDSELLSTQRQQEEEEEESEVESSDLSLLEEEKEVKRLAKKLTDLSLFPEGPPDDFSKQFLEVALSEEGTKDPFFQITEEQIEKIKKKIKL